MAQMQKNSLAAVNSQRKGRGARTQVQFRTLFPQEGHDEHRECEIDINAVGRAEEGGGGGPE